MLATGWRATRREARHLHGQQQAEEQQPPAARADGSQSSASMRVPHLGGARSCGGWLRGRAIMRAPASVRRRGGTAVPVPGRECCADRRGSSARKLERGRTGAPVARAWADGVTSEYGREVHPVRITLAWHEAARSAATQSAVSAPRALALALLRWRPLCGRVAAGRRHAAGARARPDQPHLSRPVARPTCGLPDFRRRMRWRASTRCAPPAPTAAASGSFAPAAAAGLERRAHRRPPTAIRRTWRRTTTSRTPPDGRTFAAAHQRRRLRLEQRRREHRRRPRAASDSVVNGWIGEPGPLRNLMNPAFTADRRGLRARQRRQHLRHLLDDGAGAGRADQLRPRAITPPPRQTSPS